MTTDDLSTRRLADWYRARLLRNDAQVVQAYGPAIFTESDL